MSSAATAAVAKPRGRWKAPPAVRPLVLATALFPVIWVTGLEFVWYPALALALAWNNRQAFRHIGAFDLLFFALVATLMMSLTLAPTSITGTFDRVLGAGNNLALIATFYFCAKSTRHFVNSGGLKDETTTGVLSRSLRRNMLAFIVVSAPLYVVWLSSGGSDVSTPTLLGLLPKLPGLLGEYQQSLLVESDYLFGIKLPRSSLFAPFATTAAFLLAMMGGIYLLLSGARAQPSSRWSSGVLPLNIAAVMMTLSRASILAVVSAWLLATLTSRLRLLGLLCTLMVVGIISFNLANSFEFLAEARPGSSSTRLSVYEESVELALARSPIYGIGVKPQVSEIGIPIGSHSSPISFLVRGGLLGLTFGLLLYLAPVLRSAAYIFLSFALGKRQFTRPTLYGASYSLAFLAFFLVQDIDAYASAAFFGGVFAGLLSGVARARAPISPRQET